MFLPILGGIAATLVALGLTPEESVMVSKSESTPDVSTDVETPAKAFARATKERDEYWGAKAKLESDKNKTKVALLKSLISDKSTSTESKKHSEGDDEV